MHKYNTITVGTDGSASSLMAVRTAASLARAYDAHLVIVCAYYNTTGSLLNSPSAEYSTLPVVSDSRAEEYLAQAQAVAEEEKATNVTAAALSGSPVQMLIDAVEKYDADLLVVGNRGVNTLSGRVFGNIPTGVARKANVDVMIVDTSSQAND
ncbi:universal stress protein [Corynebacterium breve]|uniref:Universal stress protein n=1 Tax=Corynebacterium breve TaxID=3049799 RepID=A0ABY8VMG3_9CORY|nr:universal stress protein [Corynebacterium breve]WIM68750.1 universal stress protein [Corynebacterium breve]